MPPQLRAGVSRAVTTPPVGIAHPFWGAQTHTRAEGVDLDLWTTALVVSDGATTAAVALVAMPGEPFAEVGVELSIEAAGDLLESVGG